jgi:AraC-like DNA-binding protein
MITHRDADLLPPLAVALLERLSEGVLVFDPVGRLVYSNQVAGQVIKDLNGAEASAESLLPSLARLGARIAPLWVGGTKLGEAVYLPGGAAVAVQTLADRERLAILETLETTGWKLSETARRLGISRTTLWRRLRAYGLDRDERARWSRPS